jgi:hypothetical protein
MICLPGEFGVAAMRLASSSEVMEDGPWFAPSSWSGCTSRSHNGDRRGVRDVVSTSCRLHCYQFGNSNFTVCDVMIDVLSEQLVSRFV